MLRSGADCGVSGVDVGRTRRLLLTSIVGAAAVCDNGDNFAGRDYGYCRRASGILRLRLGDAAMVARAGEMLAVLAVV
jgi:hypothetical protein